MYVQHGKLYSMNFEWDEVKNRWLKANREITFEEVALGIYQGKLLANIKHHNLKKYPAQWLLIVEIENYAYVIPYVINNDKIFLKTIYPDRVATKKYIKNK